MHAQEVGLFEIIAIGKTAPLEGNPQLSTEAEFSVMARQKCRVSSRDLIAEKSHYDLQRSSPLMDVAIFPKVMCLNSLPGTHHKQVPMAKQRVGKLGPLVSLISSESGAALTMSALQCIFHFSFLRSGPMVWHQLLETLLSFLRSGERDLEHEREPDFARLSSADR